MTLISDYPQYEYEAVETCLLIAPGMFTVADDFVVDTIALAPDYKHDGKTIVLWITGKKYIEKLSAQCVPFCEIRMSVRLRKDESFDLYANGDVYLCGVAYRKR